MAEGSGELLRKRDDFKSRINDHDGNDRSGFDRKYVDGTPLGYVGLFSKGGGTLLGYIGGMPLGYVGGTSLSHIGGSPFGYVGLLSKSKRNLMRGRGVGARSTTREINRAVSAREINRNTGGAQPPLVSSSYFSNI